MKVIILFVVLFNSVLLFSQNSNLLIKKINDTDKQQALNATGSNPIFSDKPYDGCYIMQHRNGGGHYKIGLVTDPFYHRFIYFRMPYDNNGNPIHSQTIVKSFGTLGTGNYQFKGPKGIDAYKETDNRYIRLYIADQGNNRIVRIRLNIETNQIVSFTAIHSNFNKPIDVVYTDNATPDNLSDDYICVADKYNHRLVWLTSDGSFTQDYGTFGSGVGQFKYPSALEFKNLWDIKYPYTLFISDKGNSRIISTQLDFETNPFVLVNSWATYPFPSSGNITAFASDQTQYCFYAVDNSNHKIYKFLDGAYNLTLTGIYGSYGTGMYQLNYPISIDIPIFLYFGNNLYAGYGKGGFIEKWDTNSGGEYFYEGVEIIDLSLDINSQGTLMNYNFKIPSGIGYLLARIKNASGQVIRTLTDNDYSGYEGVAAAEYFGNWDRKNDSGTLQPPGDYTLQLYFKSFWKPDGDWLDNDYEQFQFTMNPPSLNVNISGPGWLSFKQRGTWTANVSNGSGSFSYQWYKKFDGSSSWITRGTLQTQTERMMTTGFTMKVVVTDNQTSDTDEDTHYVSYGIPPGIAPGEEQFVIPTAYSLEQNYPNPFNPDTKIRFGLPKDSRVKLMIYNLQGKLMTTLINTGLPAGYHSVTFNSNYYSSGIYFYQLITDEYSDIKRMLLIK